MPRLRAATRSGGYTVLDDGAIGELSRDLSGTLLTPASAGYDEARSIWNAMIDRRPALIARCEDAGDVVHAVNFARNHDLVLSVRGGGHNVAGSSVCEAGLTIDVSPMKTVRIGASTRTAKVGGGATLGDFDRAAQQYGLATPLGINSTTGVAGLTLGGGFGWLSRSLGLTIDNLLSADVVTAAGETVHASATENANLFWAIRGGGGNFGAVTTFEFRLHPVGPEVLAGLLIYPLEAAPEALRFYRDTMPRTPEQFSCWFVLRQAPPAPFVPTEFHFKPILAFGMCYAGDPRDGESAARPLRSFGQPAMDMVARQPYQVWQTALDPLLTPGLRNYWKSHSFRELSDGLIDVLVHYAGRLPDPQSEIAFACVGGAVNRVAADATAYPHRDAQFVLNEHARWTDPASDAACIAWARDLHQAAAPFATGGVYVNFMSQDDQDRVRAAYGGNYDRLVDVKNRYDPANLFRVNQNIQPSGQAARKAA